MNSQVEVFMPGRLCILGEHSDWAASYRRCNEKIEKGYAIVAGLNLGIYIKGSCSNYFSYEYKDKKICISCDEVLNYAKKDFFEYVVASAKLMIKKYGVSGLNAVCEKMTLPMRKGLASSAAICVSIIRLYNILYKLDLSVEEEMALAYEAELSTGSKCGKMDQICAYGQGIRTVCFDGDSISVKSLSLEKEMNFVLVDLNGTKDTKKILSDLNAAYPQPHNEREKGLFYALGEYNRECVAKAEIAIAEGDVDRLGHILNDFQHNFDGKVSICSEELKAPLLHSFISFSKSVDSVIACKGVGSQGDGMAQILLKNEDDVDTVINMIKRQFNYDCYKLKVGQKRVNAIIPIAGMGTRMYPYTKLVDKAFLPIYDSGRVYPSLYLIIKELYESNKVAAIDLVVNEKQSNMIDSLLQLLSEDGIFIPISRSIQSLQGFGGAIASSSLVYEPGYSMVCLGDYIYHGVKCGECTNQLINTWHRYGESVVGIKPIDKEEAKSFGVVCGTWIDENVLRIESIEEKPEPDYAEKHLSIDYKGKKAIFAFFGEYIVNNDVLRKMSLSNKGVEIGFSEYLNEYVKMYPMYAIVVVGESFDIGNPKDYYKSFVEYGRKTL